MPLIKEALRTKTTLFDGFALKYIEAGRAEMKDEQESARFSLVSKCGPRE